MNYKLTPRFYYTLPFWSYFKFRSCPSSTYFVNTRINLNSARSGLRLLLSSISNESLKIGIQVFTCHTVFQAIVKAGHTPVFIDVDFNFQIDLEDLKIKVGDIDSLKITHTFGFPEKIDEIKNIVGKKIIIEDCAHSFLSKINGINTGNLSDAAIFSTGLAKYPSIGAGGFCLINNKKMFPFFKKEYEKLNKYGFLQSSVSFVKALLLSILMKSPFYGTITYSFGKKLDSRLDFADKFSFRESLSPKWVKRVFDANSLNFEKTRSKQKKNANYLFSLLKSSIKVVRISSNFEPNFYVFPILIQKRDQLFNELLINNIEPGKHFSKSITWAMDFGYEPGNCLKTEVIVKQILTLPIHQAVSKKCIRKMAEIVNKYAQ